MNATALPARLAPALHLAAGLLLAVAGSAAHAQWSKIKGGDWADASLWSPESLPPAGANVSIEASTGLTQSASVGRATLDDRLSITGDSGALLISQNLSMGTTLTTEGHLSLSHESSLVTIGTDLFVGPVNRGMVDVRGGQVAVTRAVWVGGSPGTFPGGVEHAAYGKVELRGPQASMMAGELGVGVFAAPNQRNGFGEFFVNDGARLTSGGGVINSGSLTVQGSGSQWVGWFNPQHRSGNNILVEGTLSVLDGGSVSFNYASGDMAIYGTASRGTQGRVTVDGAGSSLVVTRKLDLARTNAVGGVLEVTRGGQVVSGQARIEGGGIANVSGSGSQWRVTGRLDMDNYAGSSTLVVSAGGRVTAGDLSVGNNNGTVNRVASLSLTGAGTELSVANKIEVGRNAASGQLKVNAFAKASGASAVVGVNRGARGDVWVDGPGAHWTTAQNVTVGAFGVGVVRTANLGLIEARDVTLGSSVTNDVNNGAAGTLAVGGGVGEAATGAGRLLVTDGVTVARSGTLVFNHTETAYAFDTVVRSLNPVDGLVQVRHGTTSLDADLSQFTGQTQVLGGRLNVNGVLGSGQVTVASGAALGGTGTLLGNVVAEAGADVTPGLSPGRLSIGGNLTLQPGARLTMEIGGTQGGSSHDVLEVGGNLSLTDAALQLAFVGGFAPTAGQQFTLFNVGGSFAQAAAIEVSGLLSGWLYAGDFDVSSGAFVLSALNDGVAAPVPLPPTAWLFSAGLLGLAARLRRRQALA